MPRTRFHLAPLVILLLGVAILTAGWLLGLAG